MKLLPGLYVRAILTQGEKDDALLVPQRSLLRDNRGEAYVYTVTADNKIERRNLTVGNAYDEDWLVLDGLKPGDKVVVEGLQKIRQRHHRSPVSLLIPMHQKIRRFWKAARHRPPGSKE